ncbi:MAG: NHL repeat-containing protein [Myxococcota bacterium]
MIHLALAACHGDPRDLLRPNRIALGPDGAVYVSDFHHDRIVVFDADGGYRGTFGERGLGPGQLWRVTAMATAADGSLLVANRRPESDARESEIRFEVVRFADGEETDRTLLDGRSLQPDGWIDALAEAPNGHWVVADSTHGELVEIDAHGQRVGSYGGIRPVDAAPSGLVRDGSTLWVVEQYRHRVTRLVPGAAERPLVFADAGHGPPRFPSAVGVCPGRWLAVSDYGGHRVQRYDLDGRWLGEFTPKAVGPDQPVQAIDLAVSPDCERIYLVDSKGNRVLLTDPDGAALHEVSRW